MWIALAFVAGLVAGFLILPLLLFLARDSWPPTIFSPSDWDD